MEIVVQRELLEAHPQLWRPSGPKGYFDPQASSGEEFNACRETLGLSDHKRGIDWCGSYASRSPLGCGAV